MRRLRHIIKLFFQINWQKTIYINFKTLPFNKAVRLPIVIFGRCRIKKITGKIILENPLAFASVTIGQRYQIFTKEKGVSEFQIFGTLIFKGRFQFGTDCRVFIQKDAECVLGDMASLGGDSTLICTQKVTFGNYCRIGTEAHITDSNFHQLKNTVTGEKYDKTFSIALGNYNFISARVTILGKTKTSDYITVASNSVLNKNYLAEGQNLILGGVPVRVVKKNVSRDWEGEEKSLKNYLKIL